MGIALFTQILCIAFIFNDIFANCELCERNRVQNGTFVEAGGGLRAEDGTTYANGTFWKERETWWTCPCPAGSCLRICNIHRNLERLEKVFGVDEVYLHVQNEENFSTDIWENEETKEKTTLISKFQTLVLLGNETDECEQGSQRELHVYSRLFKDGSLLYSHQDEASLELQEDPEKFCIFPIKFEKYLVTIVCHHEEYNAIIRWFYVAIFAISIFFLLLTLAAHLLVLPIFRGLHEKIMVNQCCCFILALSGYLILFLFGGFIGDGLTCKFVAFGTHYFNLGSFFWLNIMCFEIYSTFHSNWQQHNLKFRHLAMYAWGCPLVISIIVISMQIFLPVGHQLHPGIGNYACWFQGFTSELYYYRGPALILFLINLTLFILTALNLRKMRKESGVTLRSDTSEVHRSNSRNNCKKMRLAMYLKLFLLMGCTWILEYMSLLFPDLEQIWVYTDAINYSRGVLIFWITVVSNEKIFKTLKSKIYNETSAVETDISAL